MLLMKYGLDAGGVLVGYTDSSDYSHRQISHHSAPESAGETGGISGELEAK